MKPQNSKQKSAPGRNSVSRSKRKNNKKKVGKIIIAEGNQAINMARQRKIVFHLSKCSNDYLKVLCNPFALYEAPCIPDQLDVPSKKIRTLMRGTAYVGTEGVGFVMVSSQTWSNQARKGLSTLVSFNSATLQPHGATGVAALIDTQFPYDGAVLQRLGVRTVGMAARVRYSGSELYRGGTVYSNSISSHTRYVVGTTVSQIASHQETITNPVTRSWRSVGYFPRSARDYDYSNDVTGLPVADLLTKGDMLLMFTGRAGETYDYEVVQYSEVCSGAGADALNEYTEAIADVTASHSDVVGMAQMRGFFENKGTIEPSQSFLSQAYKWIADVSPSDVSRFVESAGAVRGGVKLLTGI